jgi:hypothetical protein
MHHRAENVLSTHQATVKQGQARTGHHQYQRGAGEHPRVIAGGLSGFGRFLQIGKPFIEVRGGLSRSEGAQREQQQRQLCHGTLRGVN